MREIQLDDGSRLVRSTQSEAAAQSRAAVDESSVEIALRDFKGDACSMNCLRLLLWEAGVSSLDTMDDDAVIHEATHLIQQRRVFWVDLAAPVKAGWTTPVGEPEAPPAPAPPPPPKKEDDKIHVIPELQVEFKVVLFDRDLNKHLAGSDTKHPTDSTYVLASLRQDTSTPKFTQGAKLIVEGAGKVEAYEDAELKKKVDLAKPLPNAKVMGGSPYKLFLKGKAKGKFTLKLEVEAPSDGKFVADPPAEEKMGVVEIQMKLHEQDADKLKDVKVDPDTEPVSKYWDDLKAKALPDQKELSDADKIKKGRRLHVQKDASFGRAKLIVKKLEAAHWPDGTDGYAINLTASASDDEPGASTGSLAIADAEFDGTVTDTPFAIKVADLKGADKTFWVECKTASKKLLDIRLDAGVETLRDADWARFTGIEVKEVKIDYKAESKKPVAWDEDKEQFTINFIKGKDGRKVKLVAKLSEKIKDVSVHFMLAPDENNLKTANWGVDLPGTWKWKDITADVKHLDRKDRKNLLNLSAKTDGEGVAKAEVWLSQFGGDKFHPGAYIDQDPHLAKFVHEHADLGKRKPAFAAKTITVWRKFWYQVVKVEGMAPPAMTAAEGQYTLVKADMLITPELKVTRKKVDKFSPQAIYPRYMVLLGAGADDALVVSDSNKASFFSGYKAEGDKPIKIPLLICDAQWDKGGNSSSVDWPDIPAAIFPLNVTTDKLVLTPPLQGGNLRVSGKWVAKEPDGAGGWKNVRKGGYKNSDLSVDPARTDLHDVQVALPAGAAPIKADTVIDIEDLVIKGADGPYLGEYDTSKKRILSVFDPTELVDFQNTIAHEIGHSLHQVTQVRPAGVPAHPHQYNKQGSHCRFSTNKCVMFESGPTPGSLNRYCDVCHPYLLVQDMHKLA